MVKAVRLASPDEELTGCVQDLAFSEINRDTADVLLANHCTVHTPPVQPCCGSLHSHNGETDMAATLARRKVATVVTVLNR